MEQQGFLTKQGRNGTPRKDGERQHTRMRNVDQRVGGNSGNHRLNIMAMLDEDDREFEYTYTDVLGDD